MDRTLDLVFSNNLDIEIDVPKPLTRVDSYHPPILLTFETQIQSSELDFMERCPNFKYADFVGLSNHLASINFDDLFLNKSLHEKVNIFYDALYSGIQKFVPTTNKKSTKGVPWMNKHLRQLKNKRNKEWKRYKISGDISSFELAFAEFETINNKLYNEYVDEMSSSLKNDPSSFWRFLNSKRNTNITPRTLSLGACSSTDPKEQAELFAEFFATNFSATSASAPIKNV